MTRNELIALFYSEGHSAEHLAEQFKITSARVYQIINVARRNGQSIARQRWKKRPVEISGDVGRVPLLNRQRQIVGHAVIDATDAHLVDGRNWCMTRSGYAMSRRADGTGYDYLHRVIMPGHGVADHIDGDRLNCRRANLRLCSQQDNARNARIRKPTKTGLKGVTKKGDSYAARITVNRKGVHLGTFSCPLEAAAAYDRAAVEHFGEFACPNLATGDGVLAEVA